MFIVIVLSIYEVVGAINSYKVCVRVCNLLLGCLRVGFLLFIFLVCVNEPFGNCNRFFADHLELKHNG